MTGYMFCLVVTVSSLIVIATPKFIITCFTYEHTLLPQQDPRLFQQYNSNTNMESSHLQTFYRLDIYILRTLCHTKANLLQWSEGVVQDTVVLKFLWNVIQVSHCKKIIFSYILVHLHKDISNIPFLQIHSSKAVKFHVLSDWQ